MKRLGHGWCLLPKENGDTIITIYMILKLKIQDYFRGIFLHYIFKIMSGTFTGNIRRLTLSGPTNIPILHYYTL